MLWVVALLGSPDMVLKPPEIIPTSAACLGIHEVFWVWKGTSKFISSSKGSVSSGQKLKTPEMHLVPPVGPKVLCHLDNAEM